jgi:hypothetical protein
MALLRRGLHNCITLSKPAKYCEPCREDSAQDDPSARHAGLQALSRAVGPDGSARAELEAATETYRAMDLEYWLETAEAAL